MSQIFLEWIRPSEPPPTVKSWLKAATDPAVHHAGASHHAVAGQGFLFHAEMVAIVVGVQAPFLEGAGLVQFLQAVAGGHHALFAAGFKFVLAASGAGCGAAFFQFLQ